MAKMTIDRLLDSIPMGGCIVAYAPVNEVAEEVHQRNMAMRGEWYSVSTFIDNREELAVSSIAESNGVLPMPTCYCKSSTGGRR